MGKDFSTLPMEAIFMVISQMGEFMGQQYCVFPITTYILGTGNMENKMENV